ncbi:YitT family protein [Herbaspirillum robiniae]|uniref:YitT family protein n=1 Tax=Herbaspirillum robiniae TaxID=2014887 RepID=A0ABX2M073_9BURK|nr:YitT family protein [Herbaspirillum robiniae]NUU01001.1 YitT family protein [Herbaspirillum robiniae]
MNASAQVTASVPHSRIDDVVAVLAGTLLISFGLALYRQAGILTGGTAGISFLLSYAQGWKFGLVFFVINLPFYWLSMARMGWNFTLRTFIGVLLISAFAELHTRLLHGAGGQSLAGVNPFYIAVIGGLVMGMGFIALFRHRTSLGGINVVALYLQQRCGWRAGWVLMATDVAIVLAALLVVEPQRVAASVLGVATINLLIALNHRPGRYMGV